MMILLAVILMFATLAMLMPQGMWTAAIALVNVTTAALIAMNFWEPIASWLETIGLRRATYMVDYISLWFLFAISLTILRGLTDFISKTKVRFIRPLDVAGGAFFGLWTGWVLVCFTFMTLHTAPLGREFLFGGFDPEKRMVIGLAPDRQMLGFMQNISLGAYTQSVDGSRAFDPKAEYMIKYAARRKEYSQVNSLLVPEAPVLPQ
jgi:hypothetical protein